jgi:hypothetical protein
MFRENVTWDGRYNIDIIQSETPETNAELIRLEKSLQNIKTVDVETPEKYR